MHSMQNLLSRKKALIVIVALLFLFITSLGLAVTEQFQATPPSPSPTLVPTPNASGQTEAVESAKDDASPAPNVSTQPDSLVPSGMQEATVIKVVDGDTITVSLNGRNETIRIIGINTPETVDPRRGVECFGVEASNTAKKYFADSGNRVWLEQDPTQGERDKYNRLLRYVFITNGTVDYGRTMIAEGYAYEYTYGTPYKYQAAYKKAQQIAENSQLGLWNPTTCNGQALESGQSVSVSNSTTDTSSPLPQSVGSDKDCADFATHAEAQAFFIAQGGPAIDPHRLDGNRDGLACETLP